MSRKVRKGLVPELRFPEFRDAGEWRIRELGTFITERNQSPKEKQPLFSLTIENGVTAKKERYERSFLVNNEENAYKLVLPNDFAYNPMNLRFGAIGRHSGTEKVVLSKYYNIFYCDKTVDSIFCEIYFKSPDMITYYDNVATGSLIEKRRVHFSDFLKFNIRFPQLPEQQKIADCLSSIDDLITAQTQKLDALKAHKKGLMQQMFPAEGESVPKLRFPEFRGAGEWEERPLKKLFSIFQAFAFSSKDSVHNGIRWLKIADVGIQEMNHNTPSYLPIEYNKKHKKFGVRRGDYVIALTRPILNKQLKIAPVDSVYDGALLNQRVGKLIKSQNSTFVYFLLQTFRIVNNIEKNIAGSEPPNLSTQQIKNIKVHVPLEEEQQKIADCLSSIDNLITAQTQKIETLKAHKKGLMQQLFPSIDEAGA